MDLPPLENQTDFSVHPQLYLGKDGERLLCMVKATFELSTGETEARLAPPDRMRGFRFADVPWDDPAKSSILFPCDVCIAKPGTDVVIAAVGHAPDGQPVPSFDVFARVGPLQKALRVFGMRLWESRGAGLTPPRPVDRVEIRYDHAWGGTDDSDPARFVEEARNPVGRGMVGDPGLLTHQIAPCIEDPDHLIRSAATRPPPAGLCAIGRHWEPRRRYVGTYDEAWKELRCPLPPLDEDIRLHSCASPGLFAETPLQGGEECAFLNLHSDGPLSFRLPRVRLQVEFRVEGREPEVFQPFLDTVMVDLLGRSADDPPAVELVWRASVKAPRKLGRSLTIVRELSWT